MRAAGEGAKNGQQAARQEGGRRERTPARSWIVPPRVRASEDARRVAPALRRHGLQRVRKIAGAQAQVARLVVTQGALGAICAAGHLCAACPAPRLDGRAAR